MLVYSICVSLEVQHYLKTQYEYSMHRPRAGIYIRVALIDDGDDAKRTRRQQGVVVDTTGIEGCMCIMRSIWLWFSLSPEETESPCISDSSPTRRLFRGQSADNGRIYATPGTVPNGHVHVPLYAPIPTTTPPHPPPSPSRTQARPSSLRVLPDLTIKSHTGTGR